MRLTLVTPPAVEPLALATAKAHLRVEIVDDDDLITLLIESARRQCEAILGQALITQTWDLFLDAMGAGGGYYNRAIRAVGEGPGWLPTAAPPFRLDRPPVQSVTWFKYLDFADAWQTIAPAAYRLSGPFPGSVQAAFGQTYPIAAPVVDAYNVRFVAGYGDTPAAVPATIRQAMLLLISDWYDNRGATIIGTISSPLPTGVMALLGSAGHGRYE